MTNATKKLALREFLNQDNERMYEKNMKLYNQERNQARKILGKILYSEDFEEDFMETEEEDEDDKKNQNY